MFLNEIIRFSVNSCVKNQQKLQNHFLSSQLVEARNTLNEITIMIHVLSIMTIVWFIRNIVEISMSNYEEEKYYGRLYAPETIQCTEWFSLPADKSSI